MPKRKNSTAAGRKPTAQRKARKKRQPRARLPDLPATIADLARTAKSAGIPIWALLLADLEKWPALLQDAVALNGLQEIVANYLASSPEHRRDIEDVARSSKQAAARRK